MEITINDLWENFSKQLEDIALKLRYKDSVMVSKIESVIHHYTYQTGDNKIISSYGPLRDISNMLKDFDNYCANISAGDSLIKELSNFKTDLDMFFTIFQKDFYSIVNTPKEEESKRAAVVQQIDLQKERNAHIYETIPENELNETLEKDREIRIKKAEEMASRASNFKIDIDKVEKEIDDKLKPSVPKKRAKKDEAK